MFELFRQQMDMQRKQMEALVEALAGRLSSGSTPKPPTVAIPTFVPFDASSELWTDYWARFLTFLGANSVPDDKAAQIFLTNQTKVTYKLLGNLASQQTPPKDVRVISCQVKQHMHLIFQIWLNFSIYIGLHMTSHFPILYVHNLNGCRNMRR